jgi:hypothetical protein
MFKTTNSFADGFNGFLVFLPLLPVFLIFWKKLYRHETMNFLMVFCLLQFIQRLCLQINAIPQVSIPAFNNLFSLVYTLLFFFIFKSAFSGRARELLNFFSIAFFSSIMTYYLVKTFNGEKNIILFAEYTFTTVLIIYCLASLVYDDNLHTLQLPIFWIACGTLFFILIHSVTEFTDRLLHPVSEHLEKTIDKIILQDIADFVRYIFYLIAVWISVGTMKKE